MLVWMKFSPYTKCEANNFQFSVSIQYFASSGQRIKYTCRHRSTSYCIINAVPQLSMFTLQALSFAYMWHKQIWFFHIRFSRNARGYECICVWMCACMCSHWCQIQVTYKHEYRLQDKKVRSICFFNIIEHYGLQYENRDYDQLLREIMFMNWWGERIRKVQLQHSAVWHKGKPST